MLPFFKHATYFSMHKNLYAHIKPTLRLSEKIWQTNRNFLLLMQFFALFTFIGETFRSEIDAFIAFESVLNSTGASFWCGYCFCWCWRQCRWWYAMCTCCLHVNLKLMQTFWRFIYAWQKNTHFTAKLYALIRRTTLSQSEFCCSDMGLWLVRCNVYSMIHWHLCALPIWLYLQNTDRSTTLV